MRMRASDPDARVCMLGHQAIDRVHRIGQKKNVHVFRLIAEVGKRFPGQWCALTGVAENCGRACHPAPGKQT